jgi:hypothetical protein
MVKNVDIYRCWPNPVKLGGQHESKTILALAPSDIVPTGEKPTLNHQFTSEVMPQSLTEVTNELEIKVDKKEVSAEPAITDFVVSGIIPVSKNNSVLAISDAFFREGKEYWSHACKTGFTYTATMDGKKVNFDHVVTPGMYAASWQTWYLPIAASDKSQSFELRISCTLPKEIEHRMSARILNNFQK